MSKDYYQQKLDKNIKAFDWFILLISFAIVIGGIAYACHEAKSGPALPPDHSSLDSGWIEEHSEREGDTTFQRPHSVDLEEDSIVIYKKVSLMMYHGARIVAMRPNKTWHWLVLDSAGYNIAIVKAKRRDSL